MVRYCIYSIKETILGLSSISRSKENELCLGLRGKSQSCNLMFFYEGNNYPAFYHFPKFLPPPMFF